jgi:uncharacterized membrane protein YcaP (DUF421 family)
LDAIWHNLTTLDLSIVEKIFRTVAVYVFLVAGLRVFGKRELGQLNPLDMIILLMLSNTVQNAIIGADTSLVGGLIGAGALFVINNLLVRLAYRFPALRRLMEGRAEELIRDGRIVRRALEENAISREELLAAARKHDVGSLLEIECARLEVSGDISFVKREPTEETKFQDEVLRRLSAIEKKVAAA